MPPDEVPPALAADDLAAEPPPVPLRCLAPLAPPPARGEDVVRGEPAPTFVALAAGPGEVINIRI